MTKLPLLVPIACASLLLLAGCSGSTAAGPDATTATGATSPADTAVGHIPEIDAAHEAALSSELSKINPLLVNDKTVSNSRNECSAILGGSTEASLIESTKARFTGRKVAAVSDDEAARILATIRSNGFCKATS